MTQIFANNAQSAVASMVSPGDTTIQVASGEGALFPSPGVGDYFRVTLTQAGAESSWEILTCTERTGDVLTVDRAQEGTVAATWAVGSKVELRITAGVLWPLESSVSGVLPVANLPEGLAQLENLPTFGFAVRTENDGWQTRELLGTPNQITVIDGIGANFDPEIGIDPAYPGQPSITTVGTISSGVWAATVLDIAHGGTGLTSAGAEGSLLVANSVGGWGYLGPSADGWVLTTIAGVPDWAPASDGTVTSVNITAPAAGITATGGPITTSGSITLGLANDLGALEAISSTGVAVRTGADTWTVRTLLGTPNRISLVDGNGVAGAPQIDIASTYVGQTSITTLGTIGTGVWNGTGIAAGFGGTGYTAYADGDLLVGISGNTLAKLAIGSTNQVLTVAGGVPVWAGAPSSALNSTQIGYGNGSNVLTGTSTLTWTNSTLTMQLGAGTGTSTIRTANASSGANAASLTIQTGDANSGVVGAGLLTLLGGAGAGSSAAGSIAVVAGNNPSTGAGGSVSITSGTSSGGTAGNVTIVTGGTTRVTVASTGAVTFQSSISATSGTFSSTLESTSLRVTGSTAPDNGIYLQAAGVVGLSANNTAAYKYGSNAFLSQSDNARDLGEASTGRWRNLYIVNSPTVGSDLRGKVDVADCDLGLDFVLALHPISYRLAEGRVDVRAEVERWEEVDGHAYPVYRTVETPAPGERTHRGFGAQEVRQVLDRFGLDGKTFAGWCLADPSDPDSRQALRYEQFIAPLVKAVQELAAEVQALRSASR